MKVDLVSYTQPVIRDEGTGKILTPDKLVAYIARVSNPSNQNNHKTAPKLLNFLTKEKHWSPFDMADMCVRVETSRGIAAQILRHWSMNFQEFSQRYATVEEGASQPIELRMKGSTNRQGSLQTVLDEPELQVRVDEHIKNSFELYNELVDKKVANECARFVLPLSTTTTMYINASVRSWIHYLQQRLDGHTQKEHRAIAFKCSQLLNEVYPTVWEGILGDTEHLIKLENENE